MSRLAPCTAFAAAILTLGAAQASAQTASADPQAAPAGVYRLDPSHTSVTMKVSHLGLSFYTLRFDRASGQLDYNPAEPARSRVEVTIDPRSIDTGDPKFNTQIADQFFDAAKYPQIRFVSTSVTPGLENDGKVRGELTFHGVTRPVTLDVVFNGTAQGLQHEPRIGFSALAHIRRSEFGVKAYLPEVGDDVSVMIETEFSK